MRVLCAGLLVALLASPALADIVVSFNPPMQSIDISMGTTTVDIVANIPVEEEILGWGLDLGLTGTSVSLVPPPVIGPLFDPAFAPDGDDLAGLAPPPTLVSGPAVLLATITLSLDDLGLTYLDASVTEGDLYEGFITEAGFAAVQFVQGWVNVTPEPTSLLLLGVLGLLRRR